FEHVSRSTKNVDKKPAREETSERRKRLKKHQQRRSPKTGRSCQRNPGVAGADKKKKGQRRVLRLTDVIFGKKAALLPSVEEFKPTCKTVKRKTPKA
ncbi:hypothetical protein HAX54_043826, partial [Datura stramonium]|nr:hypothetical protein [Datura stramonium]